MSRWGCHGIHKISERFPQVICKALFIFLLDVSVKKWGELIVSVANKRHSTHHDIDNLFKNSESGCYVISLIFCSLIRSRSGNAPPPHAAASNRCTFLFQNTANQSAAFIFWLILGVKTCETYEWRKTMNTKKSLRSKHNRATGKIARKQRKTSQVFTPRQTPCSRQKCPPITLLLYLTSWRWLWQISILVAWKFGTGFKFASEISNCGVNWQKKKMTFWLILATGNGESLFF